MFLHPQTWRTRCASTTPTRCTPGCCNRRSAARRASCGSCRSTCSRASTPAVPRATATCCCRRPPRRSVTSSCSPPPCMNLEGAKSEVVDQVATNSMIAARMGGIDPRHFLSTGGGATPADANGVPFSAGYIDAGGNLRADMRANAAAEAIGRTLACRLYEATDDPGMKDMWRFLIARDTMHQQQWLAVLEELEDPANAPRGLREQPTSSPTSPTGSSTTPTSSRQPTPRGPAVRRSTARARSTSWTRA
jgi:hypothetical protein